MSAGKGLNKEGVGFPWLVCLAGLLQGVALKQAWLGCGTNRGPRPEYRTGTPATVPPDLQLNGGLVENHRLVDSKARQAALCLNEDAARRRPAGTAAGGTAFAFKLARCFISNTCGFRRWFMGFAFKLDSGPKWQVAPIAGSGLRRIGKLDYSCVKGGGNRLGNSHHFFRRQLEALAETLVGHFPSEHVAEAAMLVAGPDATPIYIVSLFS